VGNLDRGEARLEQKGQGATSDRREARSGSNLVQKKSEARGQKGPVGNLEQERSEVRRQKGPVGDLGKRRSETRR